MHLHGAAGWDAADAPDRARDALRRRRARGARAAARRRRRSPSRSCPASPTRRPRSCTRRASEMARTVDDVLVAPHPGPPARTRRVGRGRAPRSPRSWPPSWAGATPSATARSSAYRALIDDRADDGRPARDRARRADPAPDVANRRRSLPRQHGDRTAARPRRRSRSPATRADVARPARPARASRSATSCATRLAATGADVSTAPAEIGEASRDWWPLAMIWALDDQVDARAASVIVRPHSAAEVAAVLRAVQRSARSGHRRRGPQRRVRRERAGVRRRAARPHRARRASSTSTTRRCSSTCCPGTFGDVFEDELRADHGVTCGHWPQSMALSTVGGWLACRGAGQLSTRYGKIEDIVAGPRRRARRRHPRHDRRCAARRGRARPHAALRRLRGNARHHRRRAAAAASAPARRDPRRVRVHVVHRRARRDAPHRAARRDARGAAALRRDRGRPQLPDRRRARAARDGRGRRARRRRDAPDRRRGVRGAPSAIDVGLVERWMEHRNDVSALEALISRGFVVDTMEVSASWRALPARVRARDRRDPGRRAHDGRVRAPEPLVHRRRVPLLHVRGQAAGRSRSRGVLPRRVGRRAARGARGRRRAQPPPRRRPQPRPLRRAKRSAPGSACCSR